MDWIVGDIARTHGTTGMEPIFATAPHVGGPNDPAGPNGSGPIPPNALLKFEVELLSFKPGAAPSIGLGPKPGMPPGGPGSAQPQSPH